MSHKIIVLLLVNIFCFSYLKSQISYQDSVTLEQAFKESSFFQLKDAGKVNISEYAANTDWKNLEEFLDPFYNQVLRLYSAEGELIYNGIFRQGIFWEGYRANYDSDWLLITIQGFEDGESKYTSGSLLQFMEPYSSK